ncbi:hypothetical protein KR032_011098 [Drosophila birchii]|nr:hypothetical protein KR032_011098 [Drosophila birchii]
MDQFHLAIGVTTVVAMIVIMATTVSCVASQVADQNGCEFVNLVNRASPLGNQISAVEGELPLMGGEYVEATCSAVQSITSSARTVVGPYLPRMPSLSKLFDDNRDDNKDENKDADKKKDLEPEPSETVSNWADLPGEDS